MAKLCWQSCNLTVKGKKEVPSLNWVAYILDTSWSHENRHTHLGLFCLIFKQ